MIVMKKVWRRKLSSLYLRLDLTPFIHDSLPEELGELGLNPGTSIKYTYSLTTDPSLPFKMRTNKKNKLSTSISTDGTSYSKTAYTHYHHFAPSLK